MSDDAIGELAAAANRRTKALVWGFYGVTIVGGAWLFVVYGGLGIVVAGLWLLAWILEIWELNGRLELVTTKSAATVREEFSGPAMPAFALNRHMADSAVELENGFEAVHSNLLSSALIRFEGVESNEGEPDPDDDSIHIHIFEDDEHTRTATVSIEPAGGQTQVVVAFDRPASALIVLLDRLYRPLERRALAAQGYVFVADTTSPV